MPIDNTPPNGDGSAPIGIDVGDAWSSIQSDIIRHPYDFSIDYIKLHPWNGSEPLDLTNVHAGMNIFEDIFNNYLTGNIALVEGWDLPMLFPLIGEEILEVCWKRPGTKDAPPTGTGYSLPQDFPGATASQTVQPTEKWIMKFRVIKMTERNHVRDKVQAYTLHFVSPEAIQNNKKKVYKSYKKKLYSDIVTEVFNEYLLKDKPIESEVTKYEQDFCVSHWTPAQTINIIASRSIPAKHSGSSYIFYESLKNFHFSSLETLFEQKPTETFLYQWKDVWLNLLNRRIEEEVRTVDGYEFAEYFDVLANLQQGMYASKLWTYDIIRQRYFIYKFDYLKQFGEQVHLDPEKPCTPTLDALGDPHEARFDLMSTNKDHDIIPWIASKEPGIRPSKIEEYVLHRQSQMQQINGVRITLTLPGNTDRRAGNVIFFAMPNAMSSPEHWNEPEKYLSGKYLIAALRHRIQKGGYVQDIEIIKDTYAKKIEYTDPVPIYLDVT